MCTLDQDIANQIAKSQTLKYFEMEKRFKMDEEEANNYEMDLRKAVKIQSDNTIARDVATFLSLFLENEAKTKYLNQTGDRMLRNVMPEILPAEEAALIAQKEIMSMTSRQVAKTEQIIREDQESFRKVLGK